MTLTGWTLDYRATIIYIQQRYTSIRVRFSKYIKIIYYANGDTLFKFGLNFSHHSCSIFNASSLHLHTQQANSNISQPPVSLIVLYIFFYS